jgi:hypothetical protein
MDKIQAPQGTEEWLKQRLGKITASRFGDVLTQPRTKKDKEAGVMSKTARAYMLELIAEVLTGETRQLEGVALDWGTAHEPEARDEYELYCFAEVEEVGFINFPDMDRVGGSPDGFVGNDGLIEIKCPYNPVNHVRYLLGEPIPKQYIAQMQGNLMITNRQWCDFVSYDPRMSSRAALHVRRIHRDEMYISQLRSAITRFLIEFDKSLGSIY